MNSLVISEGIPFEKLLEDPDHRAKIIEVADMIGSGKTAKTENVHPEDVQNLISQLYQVLMLSEVM